MIDYRLCGIVTVVAFIVFLVVLIKFFDLKDEAPLPLYVFFCITMVVWGCGLLSLYDVFGNNPDSFVNPSITTTQYKVTQIKTNLDSDEKTYELTSEQGDKETISKNSRHQEHLSVWKVRLEQEITRKMVKSTLLLKFGQISSKFFTNLTKKTRKNCLTWAGH